ncbi:MAG: winged helix-turn-helix domain-containing protein [Luteibaculum sp.]
MKACLLFLFTSLFLLNAKAQSLNLGSNLYPELNAGFRHAGHQLLQASGDSSTRILPIKTGNDTLLMTFSGPISFDPGLLSSFLMERFQMHGLNNGYRVEVLSCENENIVYSYQVFEEQAEALISCQGRTLPNGCYQIAVLLNIASNNFSKASPELAAPQESKSKTDAFGKMTLAILLGLLVACLVALLVWRKKRINHIKPEIQQVGRFQFDPNQMLLILNGETQELSAKEAELLKVLSEKRNTPIQKEDLLQEVWGNGDAYVGRTLDVYISKLRKRLEADDAVKIVNLRGIGYKLISNN